jgi:hypothetical protein
VWLLLCNPPSNVIRNQSGLLHRISTLLTGVSSRHSICSFLSKMHRFYQLKRCVSLQDTSSAYSASVIHC